MLSARQREELKDYYENECCEYVGDTRRFSDLSQGELEELWDFFQEDFPDGL
jgi:hypothetical protein